MKIYKILIGAAAAVVVLRVLTAGDRKARQLERKENKPAVSADAPAARKVPEKAAEAEKKETRVPVHEKPAPKACHGTSALEEGDWTPVYEKPRLRPYHGTAFGNPFTGRWEWKSILVDDDFVEAEKAYGPAVTEIDENGTVRNNGIMVGTWTLQGDRLEVSADGDDQEIATIDGKHIAVCGMDDEGNMIMVVNVDGGDKIGSIFCVRHEEAEAEE